MSGKAAARWATMVAAFLAVVTLSYAQVRSDVMQAARAAGSAVAQPCDMADMARDAAMPGMAMDRPADRAATPANPAHSDHGRQRVCPFCSVASQAPLATAVPEARPSGLAAFVAFQAPPAAGLHGQVRRRPRARDPPLSCLAV